MHDSDRVFGCLLGLVFADAVGARFEGLSREQLQSAYHDKFAAFDYSAQRGKLTYTDDGQMALALAEYLTCHETIEPNSLMQCFVEHYEHWRGYGRGARVLIEAFRDDADYEHMAQHLFPGGSLGNGGAMRSAPVGIRFYNDSNLLWSEAKQSAWPTHRHELGIEGAQLIALAISFAFSGDTPSPKSLAQSLRPHTKTTVFQNRLAKLELLESEADIESFGNGIEAHESVVTALACFAANPDDYRSAVATAIWQGGDTDTIAAMTGALSGARLGPEQMLELNIDSLEEGPKFIDYLRDLANRFTSRTGRE